MQKCFSRPLPNALSIVKVFYRRHCEAALAAEAIPLQQSGDCFAAFQAARNDSVTVFSASSGAGFHQPQILLLSLTEY